MAAGLTQAIAIAHHAGLPFRLTELNSVTCGGLAGVYVLRRINETALCIGITLIGLAVTVGLFVRY